MRTAGPVHPRAAVFRGVSGARPTLVYEAIASSITTVGYGDLVPTHEATRLFLGFYLPIGIGVGLTVLAVVGAKILDAQRRRYERMHDAMDVHEERNRGPREP